MIEVDELFPVVISRPVTVREAWVGMETLDGILPTKGTKLAECCSGMKQGTTASQFYKRNWGFNLYRLAWNNVSPTFTKEGGACGLIHPVLPRKCIKQEYQAVMSYPREFEFSGNNETARKRIANSVPPLLMKAIATQIHHKLWNGDPLTRYPKSMTYPEILEAAWQDHLAFRDPDAPTVISTFAGGGGSSLGYSMAGYRELLAVEWDDNAVATFKLNFPDIPVYHGDITALSVEECMKLAGLSETGELDLLDGSPPCFPENMLIQTERGKIPIGFCTAGQKVLTHTGNYREITEVFERDHDKPLLEITIKYGRKPVICTREHPVFVRKRITKTRNSRTRKNGTRYKAYLHPEWVEAKDLKVGDVILEPHVKDAPPLNIPKVITKQRINIEGVSGCEKNELRLQDRDCNIDWSTNRMAWILGFYLAEGHTRGHNPTLDNKGPYRREVIFSIADKETVLIVDKLLEVGLKPQAQKHSKGSTRVTVSSIDFWVLCDNTMGKYADGKFIPPAFMTMPVDWQKSLLDGYFFGDGCIYKNAKRNSVKQKATTVSWDLATGIAKLVANVYGLVAGIEILYPAGMAEIEGRQVNVKQAYSVGYTLPTSDKVRPGFVDDHGAWLPIKHIKELPPEKIKVYNLEVKKDHSYTANDFAVHNCQGVSTAGKRNLNDPRNQLFREFVRLLRGLKPKVFVMENVPGLVKGKMKLLFAEIMRELKASGYRVKCKKLNAMYFYVPQSRERLIFIGVRDDLGLDASLPKAESRLVTLQSAIGDIKSCKHEVGHQPPKASELKRKRWESTKRGGNHKERFSLHRLGWNKPSATIQKTATGSGGLMYPDEPRELYECELKLIGSYPDAFQFSGKWENILNRIGNSVPPLLMRSIAEHIKTHILATGQKL